MMGLQCGTVSPALVLERQHYSTTAIHHRRDRLQDLQYTTRHIELQVTGDNCHYSYSMVTLHLQMFIVLGKKV